MEDKSFDAGNVLLKRFTYKYDRAGNKIENDRYTSQGTLEKTVIYGYDNKRNVTEEVSTSPDGSKITYTWVYEYDQQDNWTRKIKYFEKKAQNILERKIEYY